MLLSYLGFLISFVGSAAIPSTTYDHPSTITTPSSIIAQRAVGVEVVSVFKSRAQRMENGQPWSLLGLSRILNAPKRTLTAAETRRIQNAANRIDKDITVVGSRASGKAKPTSDWDYVVDGLNNKQKNKIKNSLPGAQDNLGQDFRNLEFLDGPVDRNLPHITISPE
jgi:hypothetical protein